MKKKFLECLVHIFIVLQGLVFLVPATLMYMTGLAFYIRHLRGMEMPQIDQIFRNWGQFNQVYNDVLTPMFFFATGIGLIAIMFLVFLYRSRTLKSIPLLLKISLLIGLLALAHLWGSILYFMPQSRYDSANLDSLIGILTLGGVGVFVLTATIITYMAIRDRYFNGRGTKRSVEVQGSDES
ncbi:hypothetical protein [Hahella ganghwensis]|uniref:hypothetical protein n=1 Tax=Hahella ganghwensis TaxID=286420 RepID=UPI00037EC224|nr:hypothetical protein [Hahella ganghwensis]